jgi:hypothetical protein
VILNLPAFDALDDDGKAIAGIVFVIGISEILWSSFDTSLSIRIRCRALMTGHGPRTAHGLTL